MRLRFGRQRILPHLAGLGIDAADQVRPLSHPPDAAVWCLDRIARALAERGNRPFLEGDLGVAGHELGCPLGVGREIRRKVVLDLVLFLRRLAQVDHRGDQFLPILTRVPQAPRDLVDGMTCRTDPLHQSLVRSLRQCLSLCSQRRQAAHSSGQQRCNRQPGHLPPLSRLVVNSSPIEDLCVHRTPVKPRRSPAPGRQPACVQRLPSAPGPGACQSAHENWADLDRRSRARLGALQHRLRTISARANGEGRRRHAQGATHHRGSRSFHQDRAVRGSRLRCRRARKG